MAVTYYDVESLSIKVDELTQLMSGVNDAATDGITGLCFEVDMLNTVSLTISSNKNLIAPLICGKIRLVGSCAPMIHSELSLRLARLADADSIAQLSRDLIEYGLSWRWTPERVAKSVRAANVNVLVASMHNEIAGFAIMRYGDDDAHLDLLAVVPPYRRSGIGRQLVEWLEECAMVAGIFNVDLEVRAGNEEAQIFYSRMGYRILLQLPGYYQGIEAALRMGRDLSHRSLAQRTHRQQF
jgi:[ribosomal protein S18]-alanine N-acetyltransferase